MNTDKPSVVQKAVVPKTKSSPNTTRNTEIGAIIGALVVIIWVVVRYLLDDTIKTDEDVKKYLQLDTIAAFPYVKSREEDKTKSKKSKKHKSSGKSKK